MRHVNIILALIAILLAPATAGAPQKPFPVAPHSNVTIEWWYLNAHVTTQSGKHLAMIASFFRFGNAQGQAAMDSKIKAAQSHYLIWAVTDEDTGKHFAYSLADKNTLNLLSQAAMLESFANPKDTRAQKLLQILNKGEFPPPTMPLPGGGTAKVGYPPLSVKYGPYNTLVQEKGTNTFRLSLSFGITDETHGPAPNVQLTFASTKTPMYVNGNGETGIDKPDDMHYVSLSRCNVSGSIDGEKVKAGQGWIDHQWGDSWTTERVGWDWWGVQLENGADINFFRMRDLATGRIFMPLATMQDKDGNLRVTKAITFTPDPASKWKSPHSGASYPLNWNIDFPEWHLGLSIKPDTADQEMPVLANGGYIWEGSCKVTADTTWGLETLRAVPPVAGVAYQELVGYNSAGK